MSQKKTKSISNEVNEKRQNLSKAAAIILLFLVGTIPICLIFGWLSGDTSYNKTSDNFVTAMIQNYNFIVGTCCLIPLIIFLFYKIKNELNKKFITDSEIVTYGFFRIYYCFGFSDCSLFSNISY